MQKTKSLRKKSLGDLHTAEDFLTTSSNRIFLVEAPCAMSPPHSPMSAKPRHLFLFSDLLIVAKPRNGGTFKLKVRAFHRMCFSIFHNFDISGEDSCLGAVDGFVPRIGYRISPGLAGTSEDVSGDVLHPSSQRFLVETAAASAGFTTAF